MVQLLHCAGPFIIVSRTVRVARYVRPYLRDLYYRRLLQGPEKYRPRSAWKPWNYDSEILAFRNRIGENIDMDTLRLCFTDKSFTSYIEKNDTDGKSMDNRALADTGRRLSDAYIKGYLRKFYPRLPEDWISCVRDRLLSDTELSYIGAHLGITDVLKYAVEDQRSEGSPVLPEVTEPPSLSAIATSFLAIIGGLAEDKQVANLFVRDFILTRLLHLEFCADFPFPREDEPFELLDGVLRFYNRGPPEARLQKQSSMKTLLACYQVGIYSDQRLVGEAPGETVEIAEKEATLQALRNLFGIHDSSPPLPLSGPYIEVDEIPPNPSTNDYIKLANQDV